MHFKVYEKFTLLAEFEHQFQAEAFALNESMIRQDEMLRIFWGPMSASKLLGICQNGRRTARQ